MWASGLGGFGNVLGSGNSQALTYNFAGAAAGIDYRVMPNLLVGLAAGYTGDSILNSVMDNVSMMTGFWLARLLPWKATVALVLALEIGAAALVLDNLTLPLLYFVHRFPAIEAWQQRAQR